MRIFIFPVLLLLFATVKGVPPAGPGETVRGSVTTSDGSPAGL